MNKTFEGTLDSWSICDDCGEAFVLYIGDEEVGEYMRENFNKKKIRVTIEEI